MKTKTLNCQYRLNTGQKTNYYYGKLARQISTKTLKVFSHIIFFIYLYLETRTEYFFIKYFPTSLQFFFDNLFISYNRVVW